MARAVDEWIGKTDDTAIPPRVALRVIERAGHKCQGCGMGVGALNKPQIDHITALKLGGKNREANLQCLCRSCHGYKTRDDVAAKSKDERIRKKHIGIGTGKKALIPGSKGTRFKRKIDGTVVAR